MLSMVLFWPVGGAKYRITSHQRFAEHLAFVNQNGLEAVVALGARGQEILRRRSARRAVGVGDPARRRLRRGLRQAGRRDATSSSSPAWRARCSTATPRRGAEPEDLHAPRHPGPDRAGPRRFARDLGGALPRGMPAASRILGRAGGRADRRQRAGARAGVSGEGGRAERPRSVPDAPEARARNASRQHR